MAAIDKRLKIQQRVRCINKSGEHSVIRVANSCLHRQEWGLKRDQSFPCGGAWRDAAEEATLSEIAGLEELFRGELGGADFPCRASIPGKGQHVGRPGGLTHCPQSRGAAGWAPSVRMMGRCEGWKAGADLHGVFQATFRNLGFFW